jgi:hypothetical protein
MQIHFGLSVTSPVAVSVSVSLCQPDTCQVSKQPVSD